MQSSGRKKRIAQMVLAVLFWLAVWQVAAMAMGQAMFLPTPLQVLAALAGLVGTGDFWRAVGTSLSRIGLGFALGLGLGCLLGGLAAAFGFVRTLLRPLVLLIQAMPVASFVILALIWVSSRNLSVFISFLMVLPVIYNAVLTGVESADPALLEMADVFHIGFWRRLRAIYLPALGPGLLSACGLALGLCWKSGVAAEVIGLPAGSIGVRLYDAKLYYMTSEMFAWTAVIILLSWSFGRLVLALLRAAVRRLAFGAGGQAPAAALRMAGYPDTSAAPDAAHVDVRLPAVDDAADAVRVMGEKPREGAGGTPELPGAGCALSDAEDAYIARTAMQEKPYSTPADEMPAQAGTEAAFAGGRDALCWRAVDKWFGPRQVLRGFSACIPQGSALALMGPSGEGKTTLVRILTGLEQPDAGEVTGVQGRRFCIQFQEDRLCERMDAIGNVCLVLPRDHWQTAAAALAAVGLGEDAVQRPVRSLSGGEKRRVALVRAVEAQGDVLVLDEPFKGLDVDVRRMVADYVNGRRAGRSLLLVTHNEEDARLLHAEVGHVSASTRAELWESGRA